jgi:hypothetical protein
MLFRIDSVRRIFGSHSGMATNACCFEDWTALKLLEWPIESVLSDWRILRIANNLDLLADPREYLPYLSLPLVRQGAFSLDGASHLRRSQT